MRIWFLMFFPAVLFISCNQQKEKTTPNLATEKLALLDADRAFSALSEKNGMKAAFIEYIDSNGVLLRPHHMPIIGANAIDFLIAQNDTGFVMNWQPQHAVVSRSADMGYTYGIYALHPNSQDTVIYGTYVSIWKKQEDGKWKFVLDSGNEGIDSSLTEY
jgi:ketosteroid isomerase-like protein